jgi:hypothetical protein
MGVKKDMGVMIDILQSDIQKLSLMDMINILYDDPATSKASAVTPAQVKSRVSCTWKIKTRQYEADTCLMRSFAILLLVGLGVGNPGRMVG